jgi:ATP-dependent RNA helicase DOB1
VVTDQLRDPKMQSITAASQSVFDRKSKLKQEIKDLEDSIRKASNMIMSADLVNMKRVMRRLDLCDKNDVITLKGKVACQISASDEILITEMLFSGQLSELEPEVIAALLSCLIFTDGSSKNAEGSNQISKHEKLGNPFVVMQKTADKVATCMIESKIPLDKEEYIAKFRPDLMELTLMWCQGCTFKQLCDEAADVYEGTIIRAFRRLDELISQLIEAAKIIGN